MTDSLQSTIEAAWEARDTVNPGSGEVRDAVEAALELLDSGKARVAEPDGDGGWQVNQWLKKAVLLSFRLNDNTVIEGAAGADIPASGINDKIRHLIRLSKEQGYLTFDDINEALPASLSA